MSETPIKTLLADLARPFSIYATSAAGAWAIVDVGSRVQDGQAAFYVAAVLAGLGGLYFGKSWEVQKVSGHNAEVEKERAKASPPPAAALKPATADDGELPADQRVKL
jgi:hypothetical protein